MFLFVFLSKLFWVILTCFLVPLIFFFNFEVCITFYLVGEENNKCCLMNKSFNLGDEPSEMKEKKNPINFHFIHLKLVIISTEERYPSC